MESNRVSAHTITSNVLEFDEIVRIKKSIWSRSYYPTALNFFTFQRDPHPEHASPGSKAMTQTTQIRKKPMGQLSNLSEPQTPKFAKRKVP